MPARRRGRLSKRERQARTARNTIVQNDALFCMHCLRTSTKAAREGAEAVAMVPSIGCGYEEAGSTRCAQCIRRNETCLPPVGAMEGDRVDFLAHREWLDTLMRRRKPQSEILPEWRAHVQAENERRAALRAARDARRAAAAQSNPEGAAAAPALTATEVAADEALEDLPLPTNTSDFGAAPRALRLVLPVEVRGRLAACAVALGYSFDAAENMFRRS